MLSRGGTAADKALLLFLRKLTNKRTDIRITEIPDQREIGNASAQVRNAGVTKIASAVTLEAAAAAILADLLRGDPGNYLSSGRLGPDMLPVITPFCHIPAEEISEYAKILGATEDRRRYSGTHDTLFEDVTMMLTDYTSRHPAAPHAVLNLAESLEQSCLIRETESRHAA
ncbi:MAG TPA: hypothetical protein VHN82_05030 [Methanoregula sp.]|nr:hypothetical protein [Methanoregula sp.]